MILTGQEIIREVKNKKIIIQDFDESRISTNSYDLLLGNEIIKYTDEILDPKNKCNFKKIKIPKSGYKMNKGDFILASTKEKVGSDYYVPIIHARSGIARKGLFVHCSTGLIDIGSHGNITLQLVSTLPIKIYPGMSISQVTFWKTKGKIKLYDGKYQNSTGPQSSKIFKENV